MFTESSQGDDSTLTRQQIRRIFRRHRGSAKILADSLGVFPSAISQWLSGRSTSEKIAAAALEMAQRLLQEEKEQR